MICYDVRYIKVSLYPYVMKYCEFPIGHAQVFARETFAGAAEWTRTEDNPYKGLIYCKVRAPLNLRRPLLPHRTPDGRLVFPLCRRCADERQQKRCVHDSDEDRCWIEGFTHAELNRALELGYTVPEIYEVHHWERWAKLDAQKTGLFSGYINQFIKWKLEASGWPDWCKGEAEKQRYLADCLRQDGIELDREELDKGLNPEKRQMVVLYYYIEVNYNSMLYLEDTP